jgi:hypothetical protein
MDALGGETGWGSPVITEKFWGTFASNMVFIVLMAGFALFSGWVVTLFL